MSTTAPSEHSQYPQAEDAVQREAAFLAQQLEEHNHRYHTLDAPIISDEEYDGLFKRLQQLEERYPSLRSDHSPTSRVGGQVLPWLEKRAHTQLMYGLDNVFDAAEWGEWVRKMQRALPEAPLTFWCDPKLDGLALEIIYENGVLTSALTRGDGQVGELVTEAVRTVRNVPLRLLGLVPPYVEVRGEIVILKKDFATLNEKQDTLGLKPFANPRNAAAGAMRQLDTSVAASRPLRFFAYGVGDVRWGDMRPWQHYAELMEELIQWGFAVPPGGKLCPSVEDVVQCVARVEEQRQNYSMEIDGAVIKQDDLEAQRALGFTARSPRFAVAFKFAAQQVRTKLLDIEIQVGRTGVLTPVAVLAPVSVGGVVVSRATLHNEDELHAKDVRVGDMVTVQRAGDVIPEVVGPVLELRSEESIPFDFPHHCPACGEEAQRELGQAAWRCANMICPAVRMQSIKHFVSKAGLDVQGIGQKWIEQLVDAGRVRTPADLFTLRGQELLLFERMGEVLAQKFIDAFERAKAEATLPRLISALGIRHVGEQTARLLGKHFANLDALAAASAEELTALPEVGPEVATSVLSFFQGESNRAMLGLFRELGLWPQRQETPVSPGAALSGKKMLFTGTLSMPRSKAQALAQAAGAEIVGSVSRKLDYLVVGQDPGAKVDKAQQLGITIIDEKTFLALSLVNQGENPAKAIFSGSEQGSLF